ncbi:MAG: hypothetical protein ACKPEZ_00515, partial [Planktothrix sp.]
SRIWLLCGDLGYSVLEDFSTNFPERFVNVGVAEQNMTGLAAGLALSGKVVFIYSIVNFPVMRCFEQIRNDVCYHNLNVNIWLHLERSDLLDYLRSSYQIYNTLM